MSYLERSKVFKETIVHACWSPYILLEESLVLLESVRSFFLFDLKSRGSMKTLEGTRLRVPCNDLVCSDNKAWLSCEFSWCPRILIVARYDAVFLVDLRTEESRIYGLRHCGCMLLIKTIERFLALSRVGNRIELNE
jgi:hypothetical protein